MSPAESNDEVVDVWRLTAEQRRQIYYLEKRRIENESLPRTQRRMLTVAGIYLLGCLLQYTGITSAVMNFLGTHQWKLEPETGLLESLFLAVVTLIRPFLAVLITVWVVAIPVGTVAGLFIVGKDIARFFKQPASHDDD